MNENVISVSQISNYIKQIFASEELLHNVLIYGEVSDFKISKGNLYFSLKDSDALLNCVGFGEYNFGYLPKEGDMVIVRGSPNYYTKGGRFSFVVSEIQAYGIGVLYQKFLELKNKLEKEGLFDKDKKKPLPKVIKKIGVVTSATGAVLQDIKDVSWRRNPMLNILLYPAQVQGVGAVESIVKGIYALNDTDVDVIVVARGGGSLEDLSCFNDELVARAIYNSNKPVVSAVGHETDFTIADFVADVRAPTPSAAAEILSVDTAQVVARMRVALNKITSLTFNKMSDSEEDLRDFCENLQDAFAGYLKDKKIPIRESLIKLNSSILNYSKDKHQKVELLQNKIQSRNPGEVLKMGYAVVESGDARILSLQDVNIDDNVRVVLKDGAFKAKIESKERLK